MINPAKTKIVATYGPEVTGDVTKELLLAGVDVIRLNFSHGDFDTHKAAIQNIRKQSQKIGVEIAILADLPGPKIRVGMIPGDKIYLQKGQKITLSINPTGNEIPLNFKDLPGFVSKNETILMDDGKILLVVRKVDKERIYCEVLEGGELSSQKGINLPDSHLEIPAMSEKDKEIIKFAVANKVDLFALSFVTSPEDVLHCKQYIKKLGAATPVIAKIEKHEAITHLKDIINTSDGAMVARGDLGIEIPLEQVPIKQKEIISYCNYAGKPVITATQMLESMINSYRPTRAEVADVANAVFDGTDAVMLSGETSVGKYPVQAVKVMNTIVNTTEKNPLCKHRESLAKIQNVKDLGEAVALAAVNLAYNLDASAIVCFTKSGATPLRVSRFRPYCPIIAYSSNPETRRKMNLSWGVYPRTIPQKFFTKIQGKDIEEIIKWVCADVLKNNIVGKNDTIVFVAGVPLNVPGNTNLLQVVQVSPPK